MIKRPKISKKINWSNMSKMLERSKQSKNTDGQKGSFQDNFKVYQREGLNCKRPSCKGTVIKILIANRSSFFCNRCQN